MSWLKGLLRVAKDHGGDEGRLDGEIAFHVEEATRAKVARGMSRREARRLALVEFGGAEQVKQEMREVHASRWVEATVANLRSAVRFIRRSPSFALAVVLTLGLGIGANSAVFSVVDAVLLRPLGFPRGDELMRVHQLNWKNKTPEEFVAPPRLVDWSRMNSTFESLSGYYTGDATLTSSELPEKVSGAFVAPDFLKVWGVEPALGRDFTELEEKFGGPSVVLVSDRFWRVHLHSDRDAVGKTIRLGKSAFTVVGVLPGSFRFPDRDVDLWQPSPMDAPYAQGRDSTWFTVVGRLKKGVSARQAQADLATVQGQLGKQFAKSDADLAVRVEPLKSMVIGEVRGSLWLLYGSVSVLLLIACSNITALLMARTAEREHEMAIRFSLGASRAAIVGQLLTEVLVLALGGAALGLGIAAGAGRVFRAFAEELPRLDEVGLNWRVVAYSLGCAVVVTLACGLVPAVRGSRRGLSVSMARAGRSQVSGRSRWQWGLVGVQVSLAVALLIASGLMLRSFQALGRVNPGFEAGHVLTLRVIGDGWGETMNMAKLTQRIDRTLDGLRSVPGVEAAATSGAIPGNSEAYPTEMKVVEGAVTGVAGVKVAGDLHFVSDGYFQTLAIPVLEGESCRGGVRTFDTVVVNRAFAEKYFGSVPVLGKHLKTAVENQFLRTAQIVGVVGNAREQGLDVAAQPAIYWCSSAPTPDPHYLVRTHGEPALMAEALRREVQAIDPGRLVFDVMPLEDHLADRQAENRLRTVLLTGFAGTAIALVSIGLYGTISYLGKRRRREVGLRLALGALPGQIVRGFLLQGMRVVVFGCLAGVLIGAGLSRLLVGMLFEVSGLDPMTYAGVVLLTLGIAFAAALGPAVGAARVAPVVVLREE